MHALAVAKLSSFSKYTLNAYKMNTKSDHGDLHKLEDILINFQGLMAIREDIENLDTT